MVLALVFLSNDHRLTLETGFNCSNDLSVENVFTSSVSSCPTVQRVSGCNGLETVGHKMRLHTDGHPVQ